MNKKQFGILFIILISISLILIFIFIVQKFPQFKVGKGISVTEEEPQKIIENVGKLIEIPDEIPTIATVSNLEKLSGQPLFKNAKKGDKLLIFIKSGKVIIYRPSANKIIEATPIHNQLSEPDNQAVGITSGLNSARE
jgi:hypothetical protein